MTRFLKKVTVLILIFSFFSISVIPAEAQLFVPVMDPITNVNEIYATTKEGGWDGFAWMIVNMVIERMAASTVNWINSGFKGSPAFITDPESYFQDLGDKMAGQYIFSNPNLNALCGPIQAKIRLALTNNYLQDRQWRCTLTDAFGNMEDFMNDFEKGGWDKFFELTQRQQNTPIGAYLQAENELNLRLASRQGQKEKELNWGNGFLSFKTCKRWGNVVGPSSGGATSPLGSETGGYIDPETGVPMDVLPDSPKGPPGKTCLQDQVSTPGSVISEQLNKTLGLGGEKLAVADELNEIVSALLNQLVNQIVGGIGKGLRALSRPDSANRNRSFIDQLSERKPGDKIVGYFCFDDEIDPNSQYYDTDPDVCKYPDTPNTDVSKLPIPDLNTPNQTCDPADSSCQTCKDDPSLPECQPPSTP